MPVFRVERNKGYTVMSNYHLRDKSLSLKAKGLLSQILSLPEDWDYTLSGLCYINRESKDAIRLMYSLLLNLPPSSVVWWRSMYPARSNSLTAERIASLLSRLI